MSSNTSIVPFSFESREIRTLTINDGLWFVAKDVADALEYSESSNAARLFSHIPEEWKGVNPIHTLGGMQEMLTLSEQGLYFFLNRSDKPKALPLQKWVAGEVLPSIRKTGAYSIAPAPATPKTPLEEGVRLFSIFAPFAKNILGLNHNQALISANQATLKTIHIDVLAQFEMQFLPTDPRGKTYNPTELGKFYRESISARCINLLLIHAGLQEKQAGSYVPTERAIGLFEWVDTQKAHTSGTPVKQLRWFLAVLDDPEFIKCLNDVEPKVVRIH